MQQEILRCIIDAKYTWTMKMDNSSFFLFIYLSLIKLKTRLFNMIDSCFFNKNGKREYSYLVVNHSRKYMYFVIHDSDSTQKYSEADIN